MESLLSSLDNLKVSKDNVPNLPLEASTIFDVQGKRELITTKNVESLLVCPSPHLVTKVILSSKSFMPEAAQPLAELISKMSSLTEADLSDCISGIETLKAMETLNILSRHLAPMGLKSILLNDNALGPRGIEAINPLLKENKTLISLSLCNCGLSGESIETMVKELLFQTPTNLTSLQFFNNMSGHSGASSISRLLLSSPNLVSFRWASVRACDEGAESLANSLSQLHLLQTLDLSDNSFGEEGGMALAKALVNKPLLTELNLSDTGVETSLDDILEALCGTAPHLKVLKLNDNEINDATILSKCLAFKKELEELSVEGNELGSDGARAIALALKDCPTFSYLNISGNEVKGSGARAIAKYLGNKGVTVHINDNALSESAVALLEGVVTLGHMGDNRDDEDDEGHDSEDN